MHIILESKIKHENKQYRNCLEVAMLQNHSFSFKGGFAYNLDQQKYKDILNILQTIKPQNKRKENKKKKNKNDFIFK